MAQLKDTIVNGKLEVTGETNLLGGVTAETRQNINYIGNNPITVTDDDTVENWIALGTCHAYFNTVILNSQPQQHGFLENIVANPNVISQVFTSYTTGTVSRKWARTGSLTYGLSSWVMIYDNNSPQYIKISKDSDTTDYSTSYNYFDPFRTANVQIIRGNFTVRGNNFNTFGDRSDYNVCGIEIGKDINTVRISYSVRFLNNSETKTILYAGLYRLRNGSSTFISLNTISQDYGRVTLANSTITTVQEGDFIFIQGYKGTKTLDIDVIATGTQMVIEAIR